MFAISSVSQNTMSIDADFNTNEGTIIINQTLSFKNTANKTINQVYLQDWNNAYSDKSTPLGVRYAEEFKNTFQFADEKDRGHTTITSIKQNESVLKYNRPDKHPDALIVNLKNSVAKGEYYTLKLQYTLKLPSDKFSSYGITNTNDFKLRYWYITPVVYNNEWEIYSNKDLDDQYVQPYNISIKANFSTKYNLISELNIEDSKTTSNRKTIQLKGKNRVNSKLQLIQKQDYTTTITDNFSIVTNLKTNNIAKAQQALTIDRVTQFVNKELGHYPFKKLLLTKIDYDKDPLYGLNLLPNFIRPFPNTFQYELEVLKTTLRNYLENTLIVNPRKEQWLIDGIQVYYLMKYVNTYYPDTKLVGNLSKVWGLRAFYAANLKFNDRYNFMYMHIARSNLDQPITMQKDSLLKYNKNIANKYKSGLGLNYLNDYEGDNRIEKTIKNFLVQNQLKATSAALFQKVITNSSTKNHDWFFNDYLKTTNRIDYKIKNIKKIGDSLLVTIKNRRKSKTPFSLFSLQNKQVTNKQWIKGFNGKQSFKIPANATDKLVINQDNVIPEFNNRNNHKSVNGLFNKPIQLRLFKDVENPDYNQVFFMPQFEYNFYDGLSPGIALYNKTVLSKDFLYRITPHYGITSGDLIGSGSLIYKQRDIHSRNHENHMGIAVEHFNYAPELSYTRISPFITFKFRNNKNLRSNYKEAFSLRMVSVTRDVDLLGISEFSDEPSYNVFEVIYGQSDHNLTNAFSWSANTQIAQKFGKVFANLEYRKTTKNNRQFRLRLYGGLFLYNKTFSTSDYFSFALDRPTDYMFNYEYLGRSESTGLLSQQIIPAEGGFKSKLNTPFANKWITTANVNASIWRYIMAYGDVGFIQNHFSKPKFIYDSGVRINLVEDYFELYFPVYSNNGWEIADKNYQELIRFTITLSPKTLLGLFTRRWY